MTRPLPNGVVRINSTYDSRTKRVRSYIEWVSSTTKTYNEENKNDVKAVREGYIRIAYTGDSGETLASFFCSSNHLFYQFVKKTSKINNFLSTSPST